MPTTEQLQAELTALQTAQTDMLTGKRVAKQSLDGVGSQEFQTVDAAAIMRRITQIESLLAGASGSGTRSYRRGWSGGKGLS